MYLVVNSCLNVSRQPHNLLNTELSEVADVLVACTQERLPSMLTIGIPVSGDIPQEKLLVSEVLRH